jgi:putative transposase
MMCRVLEVSTSGYYKWLKEEASTREKEDNRLIDLIQVLHKASLCSYGVVRIVRGLKQQGIMVNPKRIRRLMRGLNIRGKGTPKKFVITTDSNHSNPVADNKLQRQFVVSQPNKVWVSDITYIWTEEGWLYLAVVIDLFSRMVVGWATSDKIDTNLVCLALERAAKKRKPAPGLMLHSDRGVQYTSSDYQILLQSLGIIQSISRKGNCWDNAVAESFFRSLKVEKIRDLKLLTRAIAQSEIFNYINNFYNSIRFHSFLLYKSPIQWEMETSLNPYLINFRNKKFLK